MARFSAVAAGARRVASSSAAARPPAMLFLGAPGVGKGTFASRVSADLGIPTISTGDLVRAEIKRGTARGRLLAETNDRGDLVGDDLITEMALERLEDDDTRGGFILDGFPRTTAQADALAKHHKIKLAVSLELDEDVLVEKITSRRVCENCGEGYNLASIQRGDIQMEPLLPQRDGECDKCGGNLVQRKDDTEDVVRNRLEVYRRETEPLIKYYDSLGVLAPFPVRRGVQDLPELLELIKS